MISEDNVYNFQELCESTAARASFTEEINGLPQDQMLIETGDYAVYHAKAHQIPNFLFEIGQLREVTFRQNGAGTGRYFDLVSFDLHYTHLLYGTEQGRSL
jgi:hypothetical protein